MRYRTIPGDKNIVGHRVLYLREGKGISQGNLLAKIQILGGDMSQSKLSRIEGQQIPVSDKDVLLIASALDVRVDELFPSLLKLIDE